MRRLSRPQSPDSFLEPSPEGRLSPGLQADPDESARNSPDSATPSVLYRSSFAQECEAVVCQLSSAADGARPRCTFTIQEETLTLLEPTCSFLDSPDGGSPPWPVPESASAGVGSPDPFATVAGGEQSAGLAGASPGVVAQLAAASPISGLVGVLSWHELGKGSPPGSGANVTYECNGSGGSANATYICAEKDTATDAASSEPVLEVCERVLPFITSTPLMAPPLSKDTALYTEDPLKREGSGLDSRKKPPADPQREARFKFTLASSHGSLPAAAARNGADQVPHVSSKAPLAKKSLSLGASRALRTRGAPGVRGFSKGTGTMRKIPQSTGGYCFQNLVMPPARSGSAVQSQPVAQKLLTDEITKTDLTELPCNKKPPISIQPPSKLAGRSGVQGSLACVGLKLHSVSRDDASGTRLPVLAGKKITPKTANQKRPWEKPSDKATSSPQMQPFAKRSRLCKSQKEKPTCSDLMAVGQTPPAALEKELTAPCSQCQWLAEENQRLKSMLETCQKTIAFLEGKQTAVANENCPPQTEAR